MKEKVGITVRPIEKGTSGSGMHLLRLLGSFAEINDRFELYFLANSNRDLDIYKFGKKVIISRNPLIGSSQVRKLNLNAIHFSPLSIHSPIFVHGVPKCATLHPDDEFIVPELYGLKRRLHANLIVTSYARKMDRVLTVSQTSKNFLVKRLKIASDKLRITYNAVDARFQVLPTKDLEETRCKYRVTNRLVLHVSNFSQRKNPRTILEGFARLSNDRGHAWQLIIVGNGWNESAWVSQEISRLNIDKGSISLVGFIPTEDLPKLYNLADVFWFPSVCEGFGMPNLEAMACGCKVITSRCFAIPEIVSDGAILLENEVDGKELAERTVWLMENPELAKNMIDRAIERSQEFCWKNSAQVLFQTYSELVEMRSVVR